jgi:hypothetical protein
MIPIKMYNIAVGIANASILNVAILIILMKLPQHHSDIMAFGPSHTIVFAGVVIDTWNRWMCVAIYAVVSQLAICINVNTLEPYIMNVIRDHKTHDKGGYWMGHFIVQIKTMFDYLIGLFNTNLWVTMQVQFLAMALITEMVVNYFMTTMYMNTARSQQHTSSSREPLFGY